MSKKPIFIADTPYPAPQWPAVSPDDQRDILNLLERLLAPVAEYRASLPVSRGKKRKRAVPGAAPDATPEPLEKPAVLGMVTVGVNATTAALSAHTEVFTSATLKLKTTSPEEPKKTGEAGHKVEEKAEDKLEEKAEGTAEKNTPAPCPVAVFVCPEQPPQLHAHLPVLCALAEKATKKPVKLVTLPKGAEARLAEAIGLPRVGVLGMCDGAEGAEGLIELVGKIGACKVEWLETAVGYRECRIKTIMAGVAKKNGKAGGKRGGKAEKGNKA